MHYNQTVLLDILEQIYKMTSKKKLISSIVRLVLWKFLFVNSEYNM